MITEDKLILQLQKENLYSFRVDIIDDTILLLKSKKSNLDGTDELSDLDKLIKFTKINNINSVFYTYYNHSKEYFLIDQEEVRDNTDEYLFSLMENDIKDHNKEVEEIDFSKPVLLSIFVIYQSTKIGLEFYDNWTDNEGLLDNVEKLEYLTDKYIGELQEKRTKEKEILEESLADLKLKFEEFLLTDKEFLNCTNQNLRKNFMQTVFKREEAKKYEPLFLIRMRNGDTLINNSKLNVFLEVVWKKYKSNLYKYK